MLNNYKSFQLSNLGSINFLENSRNHSSFVVSLIIIWILFYSGFLIVKMFTKMINDGYSKTKNNESGKQKNNQYNVYDVEKSLDMET